WLPPSYEERSDRRYPVLYVHDGQAAFTRTADGDDAQSWRLDETLDRLIQIGAMQEIIAVGIHTDRGRIEMLSPTVDPEHGGGEGQHYLDFLVDELKPEIDRALRTRPGRADTAMMGSSMGGLFTFFSAWNRPD